MHQVHKYMHCSSSGMPVLALPVHLLCQCGTDNRFRDNWSQCVGYVKCLVGNKSPKATLHFSLLLLDDIVSSSAGMESIQLQGGFLSTI